MTGRRGRPKLGAMTSQTKATPVIRVEGLTKRYGRAYMQTRRRNVQAVEERAATLEREREQLDLIAAQRKHSVDAA